MTALQLLYEEDLMDCEFTEQRIDTAWQGPSLPMTALFSQALFSQAQASQAPSQSQSRSR